MICLNTHSFNFFSFNYYSMPIMRYFVNESRNEKSKFMPFPCFLWYIFHQSQIPYQRFYFRFLCFLFHILLTSITQSFFWVFFSVKCLRVWNLFLWVSGFIFSVSFKRRSVQRGQVAYSRYLDRTQYSKCSNQR